MRGLHDHGRCNLNVLRAKKGLDAANHDGYHLRNCTTIHQPTVPIVKCISHFIGS
jgi:hypothetical protein